jgi:hypothetical protein
MRELEDNMTRYVNELGYERIKSITIHIRWETDGSRFIVMHNYHGAAVMEDVGDYPLGSNRSTITLIKSMLYQFRKDYVEHGNGD